MLRKRIIGSVKHPGRYSPWKGVRGRAALKNLFSRFLQQFPKTPNFSMFQFFKPPFQQKSQILPILPFKSLNLQKKFRSKASNLAKFSSLSPIFSKDSVL